MPIPTPADAPASRQLARARAVRRLAGVGLVLVGLLMVGLGCQTPEDRYRVLSFFFDGVPVPPGMLGDMPELAEGGPEAQRRAQANGAAPGAARPAFFYHEPYVDRSCFGCHDRDAGFKVPERGGDVCRSCHASHFEYEPGDWGHGPAALGECRLCHQPHKSEHRALLTAEHTSLCLSCHDASGLIDTPHHATAKAGVEQCGSCHDPHLAGNRKLLVDSRSYRNRRMAQRRPVSLHEPFVNRQCSQCHVVEELNRVRDDIDNACRSCHAPMIEAAAAATIARDGRPGVHQALADGKCVSCHNPHQSPLPHLLRTTAEQMCVRCHTPADLQAGQHPASMVRGDCLICHQGHASDRPHLLRDLTKPRISLPAVESPVAIEGGAGDD